jgi:caffeoyl-CoA O-methyltransferase
VADKREMLSCEDVDEYLHKVTPKRHQVLASMETYARSNGFPIIGPLVGRFLYQMALMKGARRVLELGSGYGYSAFWFALAMGKNGHITMTDTDPANRERAMTYFEQAGLETAVDFVVGDALETAESLSGPYDIILNDIDKHGYPQTLDAAARLLPPGGLFITDNVIWSGRVFDARVQDRTTQGIRRFTRALFADDRFFASILPVRDGVALAVRTEHGV